MEADQGRACQRQLLGGDSAVWYGSRIMRLLQPRVHECVMSMQRRCLPDALYLLLHARSHVQVCCLWYKVYF